MINVLRSFSAIINLIAITILAIAFPLWLYYLSQNPATLLTYFLTVPVIYLVIEAIIELRK